MNFELAGDPVIWRLEFNKVALVPCSRRKTTIIFDLQLDIPSSPRGGISFCANFFADACRLSPRFLVLGASSNNP
jgi:hypothetical protein